MFFSINTLDENLNSKFEALYYAYSKYLYSIGINILKDEQYAADALQQCFIKIFENIDKIGEVNSSQTKSFISIIMRNESINLLRKKKTIFSVTESLDEALYIIIDETADTEEILLKAELQDEVRSYLSKLNKEESNLIMLKYTREYSNAEIADILGVTQEVVRQRLSRVRRKLAALIIKDREEA
ncbi:MAG TPA: sigma-70 family RNA polymerase sigma factor [Anaerovoracaceae bacterium]|nr:sigma-70 family RNA polymerase sigma factor [Anaerovoracaceae bacterium]